MSPDSFSTLGAGGVRIVADRRGDPLASAVVFLHGGGQTRRSWGRAAAAVAERGWQAITVDLRGHGESDCPTTVITASPASPAM
jgi:pimeloyl-ACP methyl ester carboxylesterase